MKVFRRFHGHLLRMSDKFILPCFRSSVYHVIKQADFSIIDIKKERTSGIRLWSVLQLTRKQNLIRLFDAVIEGVYELGNFNAVNAGSVFKGLSLSGRTAYTAHAVVHQSADCRRVFLNNITNCHIFCYFQFEVPPLIGSDLNPSVLVGFVIEL